jgi:hypothetical protein
MLLLLPICSSEIGVHVLFLGDARAMKKVNSSQMDTRNAINGTGLP